MEESLMKVLKACLLSFSLALLLGPGSAYSQQCPSNKHWKVHNGKCLPSCGAAKGVYCRNNPNKCRSNAGFTPTVKHCSKTQPSYPDGRTTVNVESYQHNGNCCLVLPPPSRARVTTPRTPASSPAPSSSANQGIHREMRPNSPSPAPSSPRNQGSSNANNQRSSNTNPNPSAPSGTVTSGWGCSGANCAKMLADESVKNLCSPSNRWHLSGTRCRPTCAQMAVDFCRDNDCGGYTLLTGEVSRERINGNDWIKEEALHLLAEEGCVLTRGKRRRPTYGAEDSGRPKGIPKYHAAQGTCPRTQSWRGTSFQHYRSNTCEPSCQTMVKNLCRGKDCSGFRVSTNKRDCRGASAKLISYEGSCCLVAKTGSDAPSRPVSAVNAGSPRVPVPMVTEFPPPRKRFSFSADENPICIPAYNDVIPYAKNRRAKGYNLVIKGAKIGDRLALYQNPYCIDAGTTAGYGKFKTVVARSSDTKIKMPLNWNGSKWFAVLIEQTQRCVPLSVRVRRAPTGKRECP